MDDDMAPLSARERALLMASTTYRERIAELEAALALGARAVDRIALETEQAVAAEREACAMIAHGFAGQFEDDSGANLAAECIAQAIRARAA